jgi:hypothetical protein
MHTAVRCTCGTVEMILMQMPLIQYVCHCDDCQAVHGHAYACSLYPANAVVIHRGEIAVSVLKSSPRSRCRRCGTYLYAEVPGYPLRGVNGDLLPSGLFMPEFHMQCRYASTPIGDALPHYKGVPARFKGSDELMVW